MCGRVSLWSRHIPSSSPGPRPTRRDILRKHEDGASLGLFTALSWNRVQHGRVESVSPNEELSHACRAMGFRVRLAASISIPNPQFPGLFPWTRHQISQWRCAHLESRAKSGTYLVRILWGLKMIHVKPLPQCLAERSSLDAPSLIIDTLLLLLLLSFYYYLRHVLGWAEKEMERRNLIWT